MGADIEEIRSELLKGPMCVENTDGSAMDVKSMAPEEVLELVDFMRSRIGQTTTALSPTEVISKYRKSHTLKEEFHEIIHGENYL